MTLIVSTIRWLVKYIPVKIFYLSIAAKYLILSKNNSHTDYHV